MTADDRPTERDDLLDRLGGLLAAADPVPEPVIAAARASFDWRTLDAELARLVADSLLSTADVRGGADVRDGAARLLTYQAGDVAIEIEVSESAGRLRIVGQVVPSAPAVIRADQPGGSATGTADRLGRFTIADLPPGPTRLVCRPLEENGPAVRTEWTVF